MNSKDVRKHVIEKLKQGGYTGLHNGIGTCGCTLDNLAPCDNNPLYCFPGYLRNCKSCLLCDNRSDSGWCVWPEKHDSRVLELFNDLKRKIEVLHVAVRHPRVRTDRVLDSINELLDMADKLIKNSEQLERDSESKE